jgi:MFS transporter, LPLT family, lysophospholipid transporter
MLAGYSAMIKADLSINTIIVVFGLFIAGVMGLLNKIHGHDQD